MEEVLAMFDPPGRIESTWGGRLEIMCSCLAKLKAGLPAAVESVYQGDRSLKEAAEQLDASPAAIGQRLSRARNLIRQCVELQLTKKGGRE